MADNTGPSVAEQIGQQLTQKKEKKEEMLRQEQEKAAKQKKIGYIVLYVFLGLGGLGLVIFFIVIFTQSATSYGCVGIGEGKQACVAGEGKLSQSECESLCTAEKLYTCTENGCVESATGTSFEKCNETCTATLYRVYLFNAATSQRRPFGSLFTCNTDLGDWNMVASRGEGNIFFVDEEPGNLVTTRIYNNTHGYYLRMGSSSTTWYLTGTPDLEDASYFLVRRLENRYEIQGYINQKDHLYLLLGEACDQETFVGSETSREDQYFLIEKI